MLFRVTAVVIAAAGRQQWRLGHAPAVIYWSGRAAAEGQCQTLPGTRAMAGDAAAAGHRVEDAGRGLPGATVRARIPSVARSAFSGITGKMAAAFQSCPAADQS
jgi:hypothetical protein